MQKEYLNYPGLGYVFDKVRGIVARALGMQRILTDGDGAAYTATVPGITELAAGATFVMIPHTASTSKVPTLDVNGLGAKMIRRRASNSTVTTVTASSDNWLGANKPIRVTFDGNYWIADFARPNATDIYGTVAVENGGTGASTAEAARENLGAVSMEEASVVLTAAGWVNGQQTVSADCVTAKTTVVVTPDPLSEGYDSYAENGVRCIGKATGKLTFSCDYLPDVDITVNVTAFG